MEICIILLAENSLFQCYTVSQIITIKCVSAALRFSGLGHLLFLMYMNSVHNISCNFDIKLFANGINVFIHRNIVEVVSNANTAL